MNCQAAYELFSVKVDDLLTSEQRSALEAHLRSCADCAREWERFRRAIGLLHGVEEARAPAGFAARVVEAAAREPWHRRLLRGIFFPLRVKLPLEAAALILVSTLVILLYRQAPELQRAAVAPPGPAATIPAPEEPSSENARDAERRGDEAKAERDRPAAKEEPKLAARAQGPFHLVGLLRPKDRGTLDADLGNLVKQVGGILIRDADVVGPGSIVEVVVPREAYQRLEAGLRQLGDLTVETRARNFPDRMRIALRISQ